MEEAEQIFFSLLLVSRKKALLIYCERKYVLVQLQNAKLQAAEGMANLGIGRKMLHKHSHNDSDDDHEHKPKKDKKHKHDDKDDDHHKDKKHPRKHDKEGKEDFNGPKDKVIHSH